MPMVPDVTTPIILDDESNDAISEMIQQDEGMNSPDATATSAFNDDDDEIVIIGESTHQAAQTIHQTIATSWGTGIECPGFELTFPDGSHPLLSYPWLLQTKHASYPWDFNIRNNKIAAALRKCEWFLVSSTKHIPCKECGQLEKNPNLMSILRWAKEGTHKNVPNMYLPMGGLLNKLK